MYRLMTGICRMLQGKINPPLTFGQWCNSSMTADYKNQFVLSNCFGNSTT